MDGKKAAIKTILEAIASGQSLRAVCRSDNSLPAPSTFLDWVNADDRLAEQYARAMAHRAEVHFDEMFEIADAKAVMTSEDVAKARLQIDVRKWALSKMMPKKFGDKVTTEHSGVDGKPIETASTVNIIIGAPDA